MRASIASLSSLAAGILLGATLPASAACDPDGDVEFVCGVREPEDLVAVPDSPWVVVSGMEDEGRLYLADTRDHSTRAIFPGGSGNRHDTALYGSCPGEVSERFRPHGISLRPGTDDRHTLYVVRHGAREAVEVFELETAGPDPALTWVGCVVAPEGVSLNSVAALPGRGFAVTNFNMTAGQVWEWSPGASWAKVPGSETAGPNGLVASADGRWLYIGGWATKSLIRLSRGVEPAEKEAVEVGFHIDNVRLADDGTVLAAGHNGQSVAAIVSCLQSGDCETVTSRVAVVDPQRLSARQVVEYPSNDLLILGTVGLRVGDEIWVGGIAGTERIARFPFPAP